MKKIILLGCMMILSSCTIYLVDVDKHIYIQGNNNDTIQSGSDLDGIDASPENDIKADATLTKP